MTNPNMNVTREFALAGKAIFTISAPSGKRYTFKVERKGVKYATQLPTLNGYMYFLSTKVGADNDSNSSYVYTGIVAPVEGGLIHTAKSAYPRTSEPYAVAVFALRIIWGAREIPEGYAIQHAGRCGRCAKTLTTPESIEAGFGDECVRRMKADKTFPAPDRLRMVAS